MGRLCSEAGSKVLCFLVCVGLVFVVGVSRFAWSQETNAPEPAAKADMDKDSESVEAPAEESDDKAITDKDNGKPEDSAPAEGTETTVPAEEAQATTSTAPSGEGEESQDTVKQNFAQYLHFALIGQFEIADTYAQALLKDPASKLPLSATTAKKLIEYTDENKNSIDTLALLINNTSIAANARKVLELVREAHRSRRQDPARINDSIRMLAGSPAQQATAMQRINDSSEYAVPWLLIAMKDPAQKDVRPYVSKALVELGKKALNPLLAALDLKDPVLQQQVVEILGLISYEQSLPYLVRIAADSQANETVRQSAQQAISRLKLEDRDLVKLPADKLFLRLAERYYVDTESLRPEWNQPRAGSTEPSEVDLSAEMANVWVADGDTVKAIPVPRDIFAMIYCMKCTESSLGITRDQPEAVTLWLAANFRREARLGLDVQSEEPAETLDATRSTAFPRSVYFARMAGPRYCRLVLARAIKDKDRDVALGAIAGLNVTAGPSIMVDSSPETGATLAAALNFPDLLVRIKAASALARAMPTRPFTGSDQVVPILAGALRLTGGRTFLLVDPDAAMLKAIGSGLESTKAKIITSSALVAGLSLAQREVTHLDGIFLASDIQSPSMVEALKTLVQDQNYCLTPVVMYAKEGGALLLDQVAEADPRVGRVLLVVDQGMPVADFPRQLLRKWSQVVRLYGWHEITAEDSTALAMSAAQALRDMCLSHTSVFDATVAQQALIDTLEHPSEELRTAVAGVLGKLDSKGAQQAIAKVALADEQTPTMRMAAFAALADSIRQFGSYLDADLAQKLIQVAFGEPDLQLRIAASQAPGAINLPAERVADLIIGSK